MILDSIGAYGTLLLICFTETFMLHYAYTVFLTRNPIPDSLYYLSLVGYFCAVIFTSVNYFSIFVVSLICFVLTALIAFFFFEETPPVKITVAFLFVALNYACTIFVDIILWKLQDASFQQFSVMLKQTSRSQLWLCILFILLTGFIHFLKTRPGKYQNLLQLAFASAVPPIMLYLIMRSFTLGRLLHISQNLFPFYGYISGLLFCTALSLYFWVDHTTTIDEITQKKATMKQMMAMQSQYYATLDSQQKEIQGILHDVKNHMQYINFMIDSQQYSDAKEYISKIYDAVYNNKSTFSSGNRVFDAILNQKLSGVSRDISIQTNIIVPPELSIDDVDICILLGNLVNNALEACNRISGEGQKKFINLNASIKKNFLCIKVSNSFNGEVRMENNIYKTVKTGERYCGIGLSNVRRVVDKYEGKIFIDHADRVFTVSLMLNLGFSAAPEIEEGTQKRRIQVLTSQFE